jgi:hypothetical protein
MSGVRIRVEQSTGEVKKKSWNRRGPPRSRRPFNPDDKCFECHRSGHYAYDCPNVGRRSSRKRYVVEVVVHIAVVSTFVVCRFGIFFIEAEEENLTL